MPLGTDTSPPRENPTLPRPGLGLFAILGSFTHDISHGNLGRHPNGLFRWELVDVVAAKGERKGQASPGSGRRAKDHRTALRGHGRDTEVVRRVGRKLTGGEGQHRQGRPASSTGANAQLTRLHTAGMLVVRGRGARMGRWVSLRAVRS